MKGRCIIIAEELQKQAVEQLHSNHIGIENKASSTWIDLLDESKCLHWNRCKKCSTCLDFQQMAKKERIIHHKITYKPWEVNGAEKFPLYNMPCLCFVDNHCNFPVIKKTESMLSDSLILTCKVIFFRVWVVRENNIRHRWKFSFREIKRILQKPEYRGSRIIFTSPPKQWTIGSLHQIHIMETKEMIL